ncbi:MAG TPA: hypothetical protein VLG76_08005 [Rhabdochlamydiaceae bacterium]|nr:hypothetical protein [Rhabdochlamydiaceae bacterium]HSX38647.1 hypothetical protein [Chlamydiales bacterium]
MSLLVREKNIAEMQPIEKWQDATPFTGRIVAYRTNKYYYQGHKPFALESSGAVNFAYVVDQGWSSEPGKQYSMSRVLKKGAVPSGCPLWDELLEEHPIQMRLATDSEIVEISKAVNSDQAEFEYGFFYEGRISAILKRAFNLSDSKESDA